MKRLWGPFQSRFIRWGVTLFIFVFSFGYLGYQIYSQRETILNFHWTVNWQAAVLSFVVFTVALILVAVVWVWIINSFGARVSIRRQFRYFCISNLARRLPGTVWYIAYRAHFYHQEGLSVPLISFATAVEFAVSVISAALISLLFAIPVLLQYPLGLILASILLLVSVIFLHPRMIGWLLKRLGQNEKWYDLRLILQWTLVYFVSWFVGGILFF